MKERELEPWEDIDSDTEGGTVGFSIEDEDGTVKVIHFLAKILTIACKDLKLECEK